MDILGIDIGGSGIKGALVDTQLGELLSDRLRIPTPQPATPESVAKVVNEIVTHFGWSGPVGCGLPAAVQGGVARTAANIDNAWIGTDAGRLLSSSTGCLVKVINDADAAGLAEMRFGSGQDATGTVLLITVGTGLGSALFHDGVLVPNTELGHLIFNGMVAEQFASAAARKRLHLSYQKWAKRLDAYLRHLERLFWPDLFILGGGISKKYDRFSSFLNSSTEIRAARLRNEAGIVGAALAAEKI